MQYSSRSSGWFGWWREIRSLYSVKENIEMQVWAPSQRHSQYHVVDNRQTTEEKSLVHPIERQNFAVWKSR